MSHIKYQAKITLRHNFGAIIQVLAAIGFFLFSGCFATNYYGSLERSKDVSQAFETYQVFPSHRYYYLHMENNPFAVIALQNSYTLQNNLWSEFDPQSDKFEKVVGLIKDFPVYNFFPYGSYLMDSHGNQVGYFYSGLKMTGIQVDDETLQVSIYTETPWLLEDDRGIGRGSGSFRRQWHRISVR